MEGETNTEEEKEHEGKRNSRDTDSLGSVGSVEMDGGQSLPALRKTEVGFSGGW